MFRTAIARIGRWGRAFALYGGAAVVVCASLPAAAESLYDPWQTQWIDPWNTPANAQVDEAPLSESKIPTLGDTGYWPLVRAMTMYEQIRDFGGWERIPDGEKLQRGDVDGRVPLIRKRLIATGDLATSTGDQRRFDDGLFDAVRRFQGRHGLVPDGVVGRRTLKAMNVPAEKRLKQIALNLDRLNELSASLGRRYVFVNIPGQELEAVEDGQVVRRHRVIVGKGDRQTPEQISEITYLAFNPYWHVPPSIAEKDILPKVRRDVSYLDRMNIRVYSSWRDGRELDPRGIDWSSASGTSYMLRQDPGRRNSLGTVKIHFPNNDAIYLHDTPSKTLFDRSVRAYSSGCVRVEDVHDLTEWLLEENDGWDRAAIDALVDSGERQDVRLARSVPVYLLYMTAWVGEDGVVNFRDDIYSIDAMRRTTAYAN